MQSTVSGSGNLRPPASSNLGFKTSGTVTHIYVTQGQQSPQGQLLATLDPQSAEVTLEQSKAGLQSAEANLASEEETDGEGSSAELGELRLGHRRKRLDRLVRCRRKSQPAPTTSAITADERHDAGRQRRRLRRRPRAATPTATTPAATNGAGGGEQQRRASGSSSRARHERRLGLLLGHELEELRSSSSSTSSAGSSFRYDAQHGDARSEHRLGRAQSRAIA